MNLKILLFNNRIYGLTKGQYSPTSEVGKVTKSTPMGSIDAPFNPVSLALGADATFVGRAMDSDRKGLTDVLRQAAEHKGTALVEIYQNCNIFNDGAFDLLKDPTTGTQWSIPLEHGKPLVFGPDGASCVVPRRVRRAADRRDQPGRGRRDRGARRAPREPGLRLRAVPAVHPGPAVHADGRLPLDPEADLRRDDGRAARGAPAPRPRPTSRPSSPAATPGRSADAPSTGCASQRPRPTGQQRPEDEARQDRPDLERATSQKARAATVVHSRRRSRRGRAPGAGAGRLSRAAMPTSPTAMVTMAASSR